MRKAGIIGLGCHVPKRVLTNADLEKMVETSDQWIITRTGIKERRLVAKGEAASDLAVKAAKEALRDAKIKAEDLDLIIVATITPDMQFPSTACFVQKGLGAKNAAALDISAACAGFIYALSIANQFISRGVYRHVLVIASEVLSSITDWKDRNTCVLFGDGAGALVLSEVKSGGILSTYLGSDGTNSDLLMLPAGGSRNPASRETLKNRLHYIKMQGNELFKIAVNAMVESPKVALRQVGMDSHDIDLLVPHQANLRIINAVAKRLQIPLNKIYINIERYGNMSAASTAVALVEAAKEGRMKRSDIVVLDAFGGGLVWGACAIKW
ncbi:beta-ketoacyl-ACP synthase III [Candidatus Omnitrophota bacterium]